MTHDELLDKIYWHWRKDPRGDGLQAISDYRRVILEVVRLHKPKLDGVGRPECSECTVGNAYRHYPCSTIEAIEKELQ